jgi:hypothetical protein
MGVRDGVTDKRGVVGNTVSVGMGTVLRTTIGVSVFAQPARNIMSKRYKIFIAAASIA